MITPYIHFQGNCREALTAYQQLFGGTLEVMRYSETPDAPAAWAGSEHIIHGALRDTSVGNLMASDFAPGFEGDPQKAVSVSVELPRVEDAARIFDALLDGGAVIHPFGPSFFSAGFGMLRDRFGTHWIVSAA